MKLIIQVRDSQAPALKAFLTAVEKPVKPNKGIPSTLISVSKGGEPILLRVQGIDISAEGLPENTFKPGDVVENTKSGNWGVIQSIDEYDEITLKCSAETRKESGKKTMRFHVSEAGHLM